MSKQRLVQPKIKIVSLSHFYLEFSNSRTLVTTEYVLLSFFLSEVFCQHEYVCLCTYPFSTSAFSPP